MCLLYSCVIFLVTSYFLSLVAVLYSERCIFLCHILGNLVLLHHITKHALIVFLCHILGNLILPEFGSSSVFQKVHILVSYSWQPHIIAPYSEHALIIFLCHILGNLILLHHIPKGAYSCVIFYSNLHTFLCYTTCVV